VTSAVRTLADNMRRGKSRKGERRQ